MSDTTKLLPIIIYVNGDHIGSERNLSGNLSRVPHIELTSLYVLLDIRLRK